MLSASRAKALELLSRANTLEARGELSQSVECYRLAYRLCPELEHETFSELSKDAKLTCLDPLFTPSPECGFQTFPLSDLSDPERSVSVRQFFDDNGYLVVTDALSQDQTATAYGEFEKFMALEGVDLTGSGPVRGFGDRSIGIVGKKGCGHSSMNWFVRSCQGVKDTFRFVHGMKAEDKLITSFDGFNWFRNPEISEDYASSTSPWFHFDAGQQKDHNVIQGLVNLVDCTDPMDAGLVLLPKSHRTVFPHIIPKESDFPAFLTYMGPAEERILETLNIQEKSFRVPLPAGAIAVWRSSVLHCNTGCLVRAQPNPAQVVRRVAVYVCMGPDPQNPKITQDRLRLFHKGGTTGHHPELCRWVGDKADDEFIARGVVIVKEADLPSGAEELL